MYDWHRQVPEVVQKAAGCNVMDGFVSRKHLCGSGPGVLERGEFRG